MSKSIEKEINKLAAAEKSLEIELAREIKYLSKEIAKMKDMEVIQVFKNPWKFLGFSLMKGIMVGFGSVLGATIFLSLFVYLLAQISLVPVVGDFVKEVMQSIENTTEVGAKDSNIFEQYHKAQEELKSQP